eukprot:366380-Chlamydomonas_euryale.AAC.3
METHLGTSSPTLGSALKVDTGQALLLLRELSHLHDRKVARQVQHEPGVLPDLRDGDALERVYQQHARNEVSCTRRQVAGKVVDAALDLRTVACKSRDGCACSASP